ncbi:MAG: thioredoxin domain-containing protein [Bacteroidetes bacterium]|nr:MAG: thioredoxin domain-containing protein [Bacteroidota bacterium]
MNRLSTERSPYLRQHAGNPVHWHPWGDEAFDRARREHKPIFLSVGYSTCHWCHVMEHESFEDPAAAAVLNELFVSIKVDREERPDVDKVYMSAVQAMTGHGGWPLSVFLTPDLKPFYGGTYFPPRDAHGRPGFITLLRRIAEVWNTERENVLDSAEQLTRELQRREYTDSAATDIGGALPELAVRQFSAGYDALHAGFGRAPKFPRPAVLSFLMRRYHAAGDDAALRMALDTLTAMSRGGMMDQLGGGFHRYSVDARWHVPHFEKMLYDQAQLITVYVDAFRITGDASFAVTARRTADYVLRELSAPDGGFASAEDADSADPREPSVKREGAYYVWEKKEIEQLLPRDIAELICTQYGIADGGNVQEDAHGEFTGRNILFAARTAGECARELGLREDDARNRLELASAALLAARIKRPRPHRDEKVIAAWNGMTIGALSQAYLSVGDERYRTAAADAARFVWEKLYDEPTAVLRRRYCDGEVKHDGLLDDYANLAAGFLDLYEATYDAAWLRRADLLTGRAVTLFWDSAEGGFFDTAGKDPSILVRTKDAYDGAEPSGNAVMVMNLLRLHRLTGNDGLRSCAEKTLKLFMTVFAQAPQIMPYLLCAADLYRSAPDHCLIVPKGAEDGPGMDRALHASFRPWMQCVEVNDGTSRFIGGPLAFSRTLPSVEGRRTYYRCSGFTCRLPVTDAAAAGG